jgi:hypothetical protein
MTPQDKEHRKMRSNQLRLLLLSVMAVVAISAVASASASAACYRVAEAGTGHWENSACTVVGTTKEYVKATTPITQIKPGEWCAKAETGEPSTFEDEKCTKAKTGTGQFIKVKATCFMVAVAGTGNYSSSEKCEKKEASSPKEWVMIEKLENEVSPGIWCAKAKTGEPSTFKDNKCTEAETSTGKFIKVVVSQDIWQVCQEVAGEGKEPPVKFDEHKCNTKTKELKLRKWSWLPIATGASFSVTSSGGVFTLTAAGKTITCQTVEDTGTIESGGKDKASTITFKSCTTGTVGCAVKNKGGTLGTIAVTEIPTQLEQALIGEEEILVNKFEQKLVGTTKEFVTLEFEGAPCAAPGYVTTKVKGDVAAEVKNEVNGEVKVTFPSTAIPQSVKLEAFGVAATLTGSDNETLVNGWAFRGV